MSEWVAQVDEFADLWAEAMVRACWQGGVALALAWAVCWAMPRLSPRLKCWLWRLAYLKLLITALWVAPVELPLLPARPIAVVPQDTQAPAFPPGTPVLATLDEGMEYEGSPVEPAASPGLTVVLLLLWLLGVCWSASRLLRAWHAVRRFRRNCEPVRGGWAEMCCSELCQRIGLARPPRLLVAEGTSSPFLIGVLHPAIVFPASRLQSCSPLQLRLMLAHELAHLKRHDLLWNWLPTLVHGLFFFHPLDRLFVFESPRS